MAATATVVGNLGKDPEKKSSNGTNFAVFSVASNTFAGGEEKTTWFDVIAFGPTGKFAVEHVKKGSGVMVTGDLGIDEWEQDGVKRQKPKIVANSIKFVNLGGGKKDKDGDKGDFAGGGGEGDFAPSGGGGAADW